MDLTDKDRGLGKHQDLEEERGFLENALCHCWHAGAGHGEALLVSICGLMNW